MRLHKRPVKYGKERRWGQIRVEDGGVIDIFVGTPYMTADTLIHEILHSVFDSLGHKSLGNDEKFIGQLATALTEVIWANWETLEKLNSENKSIQN